MNDQLVPNSDNLTILVVDDNNDMREIMEELIICYGHKTESAINGQEAVKKACEKNYDLILMDIQMPVMDGFQALDALKMKNIQGPIAAVTAHSLSTDQDRCMSAGFNYFLSKPINFKIFKDLLDDLNAKKSVSIREHRH